MCRRILALLLIVGWVALSGFDLLEDIEVPSDTAVSSPGTGDGSSPTAGQRGNLVNNIVESADRVQQAPLSLFSLAPINLALDAALDFRRCFRLHKLYQVFLI